MVTAVAMGAVVMTRRHRSTDWVRHFYSTRSGWFGPTGIFPEHRSRALDIARLCGGGPKRILELGAGAGGTAAAMADLGHIVVAVELSPVRAAFARALAQGRPNITVLEADFYTVYLQGLFDAVCYFDGFGVGQDADQRRLLQHVQQDWLAPRGVVLLDVFSPSFWAARARKRERIETVSRLVSGKVRAVRLDVPVMARYDFDAGSSRYLSEWWLEGRKQEMITESVRCYTPPDFVRLLEGTGLVADRFEVNGELFEPSQSGQGSPSLMKNRSYRVRLIHGPASR